MSKKLTVEVVIAALNEGAIIKSLIEKILIQSDEYYKLKFVSVYSDGSTDNTVSEVRSIPDKRVRVFVGKTRKSKFGRINQAYSKISTDLIVVFDADVALGNDNVIDELVKPFLKNKKVGLVGANSLPAPKAETLVEQAINNMISARNNFRYASRKGHNVYGIWGSGYAVSNKLASRLRIQQSAPEDAFTYFSALQMGFLFRHAPKALVYVRFPETIKDQIKQGVRFSKNATGLSKYFDEELIKAEYAVNSKFRILAILEQLFKNPFLYILVTYMHYQVVKKSRNTEYSAFWEPVTSTKRVYKVS